MRAHPPPRRLLRPRRRNTVQRYAAYIQEALDALWQNRTRSILTILGMIIGTFSVIAVFGVSRATATGISATLGSFGDPGVWVQPDPTQDYPDRAAIEYRDVAKVQVALDGLAILSPQPFAGNLRYVSVMKKVPKPHLPLARTGLPIPSCWQPAGRSPHKVQDASRVCAMTWDLAVKYFGHGSKDLNVAANNAVGSFAMTLNGSRFRVIGVYGPISGVSLTRLQVREPLLFRSARITT